MKTLDIRRIDTEAVNSKMTGIGIRFEMASPDDPVCTGEEFEWLRSTVYELSDLVWQYQQARDDHDNLHKILQDTDHRLLEANAEIARHHRDFARISKLCEDVYSGNLQPIEASTPSAT